jgi:predicted nucleic acid-binding protein
MLDRYYFDTSLWIDMVEKRGDHGEIAIQLMQKIILEESKVIVSTTVLRELGEFGYTAQDIKKILDAVPGENRLKVQVSRVQFDEAKRLSRARNMSMGDAMHAIMARDTESILVTRDFHFQKVKDVARSFLPEQLL